MGMAEEVGAMGWVVKEVSEGGEVGVDFVIYRHQASWEAYHRSWMVAGISNKA